jgi:peptidoglycan/xylan/chitin deacetylase (PgdA/CDA1 family)
VQTERASTRALSPVRLESQRWVDASIPRKPIFDWRERLIRGMHMSGALRLARRVAKSFEIRPGSPLPLLGLQKIKHPKFVILCYHGIGESVNPLGTAPSCEIFEQQMLFLRENYRVVSLEVLCRELSGSATSEPGVAITFDDGYRSTFTMAFPILQKYQLPATIYLMVDPVETNQVAWYDRVFLAMALAPSGELQLDLDGPRRFQLNSRQERLRAALEIVAVLRTLPNSRRRECSALLEKRISLPQDLLCSRILTWDQIRTMQNAGITFGSHTMTHPVVSQLDSSELERELTDSKRLLEERLGRPVVDFAFPFGKASDCSAAATQALERSGYRSAVTTVPGVNTPEINPYELRRLQVGDDSSVARLAFDLDRVLLRMEQPYSLISHPSDSVAADIDQDRTSVGRMAGGADA